MSIVVAVVTGLLCGFILRTMQTPENIFEGAYIYLLITFIGVPCTFFYNLLSCIIRALGDSKTPFWFLLLSTVLNIVLDLFFYYFVGMGRCRCRHCHGVLSRIFGRVVLRLYVP